jgi:YVTN family beta-propeller protein
VNHLPIDPGADSSRRAWLPCPNCNHGHDCPHCQSNHNCETHWQYLLKNEGTRVSLQCPTCAHLWTVDTAQARSRERDVVATIALGGHACDVVVSPDGDRIYVTTAKAVTVIDRAHRVVANIPVDVDPKRTVVSPDGSRLYVIGYNGSISIVNAVDYTVRTVVRDASTAEIISPADNYLYLAHNQGANCWVSAMSEDGTTATAVPVYSYASALTLSPDGSRLYVASSRPRSTRQRHHGSISVIDTATFMLIDVIAMQFSPDTIVVSPDGSRVYATHYHKNAVSAIELASHSHTLIGLDDAPLDVAVSPDGELVYVTNLHCVALIDTATNVAESVPIGDLPRQLHISRDGKQAYVTDFGHHCVWVLDPVNKTIITTVDLGRDPETLALSADEEFLYVADYSVPTLTVISLVSSERSSSRTG